MGTDIDQEEFGERDYPRFAERLEECLSALGQLLERPGFGVGPATIGAELELFLINGASRPLPHNLIASLSFNYRTYTSTNLPSFQPQYVFASTVSWGPGEGKLW